MYQKPYFTYLRGILNLEARFFRCAFEAPSLTEFRAFAREPAAVLRARGA